MEQKFEPTVVAKFENETWSRCAEGYMEGFGPLVLESVDPLMEAVELQQGEDVLDVGTGPGIVASAATGRGARVVGIDFSEAMLTQARKLHPEISFQNAIAESLPFKDRQFDVVVGNFVLHHSGNPEKVLEEAFRVLRDSGRVAFTVWAGMEKLEAFGLFFAAVEEHAGEAELPHGPLFGVSDFDVFSEMVLAAGFREPTIRELSIAWRTPTIDSYLGAFRNWAQLEVFPKEIQTVIENTVRNRSIRYQSENGYMIPNPAILISAKK